MSLPVPKQGLVVRYFCLWQREAEAGREEGIKDRPCAVVLVILRDDEKPVVRVLPISHYPPDEAEDGLEIPALVKNRLGLDWERYWVIFSESNDFVWPGPDLRPALGSDMSSVAFGFLPPRFMSVLLTRIEARRKFRRMRSVARTA